MISPSSSCMNSECEQQKPQNKAASISKHLVNARSKPGTRIKILQRKHQENEVKKFRDSVRTIYHQSDFFASYTQHSIASVPPESSNIRILLSQNHYSKYKAKTENSNSQNNENTEININESQKNDDIEIDIVTILNEENDSCESKIDE